jgi:predicted transcriptional regulator
MAEQKLKLPSRREITIAEGLRFCYDLSETDTQILLELLGGGEYSVDELASKLGLSKATVNRSLNKLVELGFVMRRREKREGVGRPKFKYYIEDPMKIVERIERDVDACAEEFKQKIRELIQKRTA